jgi:hypothetical protein
MPLSVCRNLGVADGTEAPLHAEGSYDECCFIFTNLDLSMKAATVMGLVFLIQGISAGKLSAVLPSSS